jgi:hypothetical protein
MLTVIELVDENKGFRWKCLCDCGKITLLKTYSLMTGHTRSCGCFKKIKMKEVHWDGYEEISGRLFSNLKSGAIKRKIDFNLNKEQLWNQFIKQNKKCALTGVDISIISGKNRFDSTASLDRIDSSKGYTEDNIQWVHKKINIMKHVSSDEEFIEWCKLVVNYNKEKE